MDNSIKYKIPSSISIAEFIIKKLNMIDSEYGCKEVGVEFDFYNNMMTCDINKIFNYPKDNTSRRIMYTIDNKEYFQIIGFILSFFSVKYITPMQITHIVEDVVTKKDYIIITFQNSYHYKLNLRIFGKKEQLKEFLDIFNSRFKVVDHSLKDVLKTDEINKLILKLKKSSYEEQEEIYKRLKEIKEQEKTDN